MITLKKIYLGQFSPSLYLTGLTFDFNPEDHTLAFNYLDSSIIYQFTIASIDGNGLQIGNAGFVINKVVLDRSAPLQLIVLDKRAPENILLKEEVSIDPSFFADLVDRISTYQKLSYKRPKTLAVFTHVFNEKLMLGIFLKYYEKIVPKSDIYVINHASDPDSIDPFRNSANILDIPRGETDHTNIASFCGYFQRFLLTQYDWVIHVDCDELIITEKFNNDLSRFINDFPVGSILKPKYAYEMLHDFRAEAPLDLDKCITLQRNTLIENLDFQKPAVGSTPTSWVIGFHSCLENAMVADDLWLIHLRDVDVDHSVSRDAKWNKLKRSVFDTILIKDQDRPGEAEFKKVLLSRLESENVKLIPEWMRGLF